MPKRMPLTDFRARRTVLLRSDFAIAPKPAPPPSDLIEESIWNSIVILTDDVAIRTSNYHGTTLKQLNDLWGAWVECYGNDRDFMFPVMLDAADDFQAATYASMTGYYRLSVAALRSALELIAIGTWAQVCGKKHEFKEWRKEKVELSHGKACDGLIGGADELQKYLRSTVGDSLFDQQSKTNEGGFVRRIYNGISNFAHSRPGSTDGDMRKSNGPIYVRSAFNHVAWIHFETFALCSTLLLLARPQMQIPADIVNLLADTERVKSRVTRAAFNFLYQPTRS